MAKPIKKSQPSPKKAAYDGAVKTTPLPVLMKLFDEVIKKDALHNPEAAIWVLGKKAIAIDILRDSGILDEIYTKIFNVSKEREND